MCPELFSIGNLSIKGYGTMMAIGILVAVLMSMYRGKKRGFSQDSILDIALYGVIGGLIGAKLLYIVVEIPHIVSGEESWRDIIFNGFVIYGAILGGVGAAYIYCRIKKLNFIKHFDLVAPEIAIAQGIGRIGCLLAGCCYGSETSSRLSIVFPEGAFAPAGVRLYPTQIYSTLGDFAIAIILLIYYDKRKNRKDGYTALLYLTLYSIGRFFLEFLRGDERGDVGALSTSQFIAIILLVLCIAVYVAGKYIKFTDAPKQEDPEEEDVEEIRPEAESDTKVIFDIDSPENKDGEEKEAPEKAEGTEDKNN